MQGGSMRINEGNEMFNLYDGDELVASVNFSVFGRNTAQKVLEDLKKSFLKIKKGDNSIAVVNGEGRSIISFYWHRRDNWRYGIETKQQAIELAKEFVRLYKSDEELPLTRITPSRLGHTMTGVNVYVDDDKIAFFREGRYARKFAEERYSAGINLDDEGLSSHSSAWNKSILTDTSTIKEQSSQDWVKALMKYMDDNWGRCD